MWGHSEFRCYSRTPACGICAGGHRTAEHRYEVATCGRQARACEHTRVKCPNCGEAHLVQDRRCRMKVAAIGIARENGEPRLPRNAAQSAAAENRRGAENRHGAEHHYGTENAAADVEWLWPSVSACALLYSEKERTGGSSRAGVRERERSGSARCGEGSSGDNYCCYLEGCRSKEEPSKQRTLSISRCFPALSQLGSLP
jgi:predicted RNA-binding Zn-ribbon protein involved in translation (DUF1610 family)